MELIDDLYELTIKQVEPHTLTYPQFRGSLGGTP